MEHKAWIAVPWLIGTSLVCLVAWLIFVPPPHAGQEARATWTDSTGKHHAVITVQDAGESVEDFLARHKAAIEAER
jgi:hypothetical protein